MNIVYIIKSQKTKKRYIGFTQKDIAIRLAQHNNGENRSTKSGIPWELIYLESNFANKTEALKRENILKKMKGGNQLKVLLEKYKIPAVPRKAVAKNARIV